MEECNSMSAQNVSCGISQNRCLKVMMSQDGKESGLYGCASERDCMTAIKSCEAVEKNNARAKCMSQCCNTASCNTPPAKSMVPVFVITFKLNFIVVNHTIGSSPGWPVGSRVQFRFKLALYMLVSHMARERQPGEQTTLWVFCIRLNGLESLNSFEPQRNNLIQTSPTSSLLSFTNFVSCWFCIRWLSQQNFKIYKSAIVCYSHKGASLCVSLRTVVSGGCTFSGN